MRADPYADVDYRGEPIIIKRGYQLCSLLNVCEQVASSLENVGEGKYRDRVTSSLSNTLELAEELATQLLCALEHFQLQTKKGGSNG